MLSYELQLIHFYIQVTSNIHKLLKVFIMEHDLLKVLVATAKAAKERLAAKAAFSSS